MQKIEFDKPKELLRTILATDGLSFCEYIFTEDILVLYDHSLCVKRTIPEFLNYIKTSSVFHPEDQWKLRRFFQERSKGEIEIHVEKNNVLTRQLLQVYPLEGIDHSSRFLFIIRDVTWKKDREALLEIRAMRDSLTMLYNHFFGRDLINEYLSTKDPYASCGLMVIDLDYFKYANDTYGHLFGDQVLVAFARLLTSMFEEKDILIRAGGDEFVVFLKDISHTALVKKSMQLINAARELTFKDKGYSVTCSAPISFAASRASFTSYTGSLVPGTTGTPASIMVFLASDLFPILWMISAEGPIKVTLHFSHISTNLLFSERKPKPGWIASALVAMVALKIRSIFR